VKESNIHYLVDMGIPRDQAKQVLESCNDDLEMAITILFNHD